MSEFTVQPLLQTPPVATHDVHCRGERASRASASASGRDIYAVTAALLVEALQRVFGGRAHGHGALAPGQAFDARDFLAALAPAGVAVTFEETPMAAG